MKIDLKLGLPANVTVVSNEFIDQYMAAANGEYVKVFLYLLRHFKRDFYRFHKEYTSGFQLSILYIKPGPKSRYFRKNYQNILEFVL